MSEIDGRYIPISITINNKKKKNYPINFGGQKVVD